MKKSNNLKFAWCEILFSGTILDIEDVSDKQRKRI